VCQGGEKKKKKSSGPVNYRVSHMFTVASGAWGGYSMKLLSKGGGRERDLNHSTQVQGGAVLRYTGSIVQRDHFMWGGLPTSRLKRGDEVSHLLVVKGKRLEGSSTKIETRRAMTRRSNVHKKAFKLGRREGMRRINWWGPLVIIT